LRSCKRHVLRTQTQRRPFAWPVHGLLAATQWHTCCLQRNDFSVFKGVARKHVESARIKCQIQHVYMQGRLCALAMRKRETGFTGRRRPGHELGWSKHATHTNTHTHTHIYTCVHSVAIPSHTHAQVWSVAVTLHRHCAIQHQHHSHPSRTWESPLRALPAPGCVATCAHRPACTLSGYAPDPTCLPPARKPQTAPPPSSFAAKHCVVRCRGT
jgi:hypothetical protein